MHNNNPINPGHRVSPPSCSWLRTTTCTSAAVLGAVTVAMTVLLTIYPHIGIIGFSTLTTAEGLSFVLFATNLYLLNKKQNKQSSQIYYVTPSPCPDTGRSTPLLVHQEEHDNDISLTNQPSPEQSGSPTQVREDELAVAPVSIQPLAHISLDEFLQTLPEMFTTVTEFLVAFVSAYSRSISKQPSEDTLNTIRKSIQTLKQVVTDILCDHEQLFRCILRNLVISHEEKQLILSALSRYNDPIDFMHNLPNLVPERQKPLFTMIAEKFQTQEQNTLQRLYQDLQKKATPLARQEAEYDDALMTFLDWLSVCCNFEESSLQEVVANNASQIIESIRANIFDNTFRILNEIQTAYRNQNGTLNNRSTKAALFALTAVNGKPIRFQANKIIRSLPLKPNYVNALINGCVERLVPTLTNPVYNATVGDANIFSTTPHPFRATLNEQIFDKTDDWTEFQNFQIAAMSQNWPTYSAAFIKIIKHFTTQLNNLNFNH